MVKVVGYARVSSKSQADNTSLAEQKRVIELYCSERGLELIGIFSDVGSGKSTTGRPGFESAMSTLADEDCQAIVGAKIDRLGRNTIDLLLLGETVREQGKEILVPGLNIDLETSAGRMFFRMLASAAEFDVDIINERFESGRKATRRAGGNIGGAPPLGKRASDKKHAPYEDVPEEMEVIKIIKNHRRSGKGLSEIARYLNKRGILTKRGKEWKPSGIQNILNKHSKTAA